MQPTPEEKQHVLDLVQELKEYVRDLPLLLRLSMGKRKQIADRMIEIKKELQKFRVDYPNA